MSIEKAYQEWCENFTEIPTDEEVFTAGYEAGVRDSAEVLEQYPEKYADRIHDDILALLEKKP